LGCVETGRSGNSAPASSPSGSLMNALLMMTQPILLLLYLRSSGWQLPRYRWTLRQNQMGRRAAITWNLSARKKFSPIERRCQRVLVQDVIDLTAPIREE
jgi:hypothetical protein